ncbi:alanyl (membrane) aminopeptidase b, tandem duplicate 1 [Tachysurus fulvidraco]|uniref:alanyl (membrane) aminopeptidase b, tandem duplicate 1 n=1 Tax=Tachysurus fulvidraco TaxID=1234273 RepID=UPI000F4F9EB9|nr:alanyl (membrane) aminopeptidase b, tandem duplicate 1 [Tachysurus fulvidraco]
MGKGFYISKTVGIFGIVLAVGAVATIIALSVVYSEEKSRNKEIEVKPTEGTTTTTNQQTTNQQTTNQQSTNQQTTNQQTTIQQTTNQSTTNQSTTPAPIEPWDSFRLPDTLIPEFYDITLWPRLKPNAEGLYIFTGNSSVVFKCVKETDLILIHANKLNLTSEAVLTTLNGSPAPSITSNRIVSETQYFVFHLSEKLKAGDWYRLHTEFIGELADDLGGFYRSEYEVNNVKKVVATTQMQATDARKAFPCFDEPAMKAYFNITLLHEPGTIALSNGREIDSVEVMEGGEKLNKTRYEKTQRMSTYLLAFIVSDFKSIEKMSDEVLIRIFARQEAIDAGQGDYALNKTSDILKFFEGYYKVKYPLTKSDQVALPDFNAGAMENWGLITYRETALLYDSEVSSNGNKERVATIIAHELAHMWFGNLVTIKWWNDLWLNEGFASYVEYLGANSTEPDWHITDLIVLNDVHRVFAVDALASSHPLSSKEEEVLRPEQISEVFDAISYSKGASVLRMLSDFLTEEVFNQGLTSYLNHFQFQNTVYTDLWDHLQQAVDASGTQLPLTVSAIMDRWVLQMGFPVVTVNTTTGAITQAHFLLDPESVVERPSPFNYEWIVPIQWMKNGDKQNIYWLKTKNEQNNMMKMVGSDWMVANLDVLGYYRVNYDRENWMKLINKLQTSHKNISVINRAQIIDDAFNLARARIIETELALDTTLYLSVEREYMPWESALDNLDYFYLMFDRTEIYGLLQNYTMQQVEPLFQYFEALTNSFTTIPDHHMDQYNEVNALRVACSTGVVNCTTLVKTWFEKWMSNPSYNPIHPNLRSTVYCQAIAAGGATEWDFAWSMFKNATIATEADKLRAAMACSSTPEILKKYLTYTLDPTKIRKQDATSTIIYVANNVVGQPLAWDFIRANWEYIYREYGGGSFSFANLINGVTKRFSTESDLNQLEQFKKDNEHIGFGSGSMAIEQSIERTKANIKWLNQNRDVVKVWLEAAIK